MEKKIETTMLFRVQGLLLTPSARSFLGHVMPTTVGQVTATMLYLEGQGDLVSSFITPKTHIVTPIIPIINLVTKSP